MDLNEVYKNSGLGKWFHGESANKTPGWDRYNSEGKLVGECGDAKKGDSYSACLSKQKAQKLGKEGIASFVERKRAAQSEAGRGEKGTGGKGQKPINVDTGASKMDECVECNEELELINEGKNKPNDSEKWSACKSAAKSKFDVYPSAYANAWAAKCYKKKGGTWRSVKEEVQQLTRQNIISNLLETKMKDGPGKTSQRPKSWDKGTKSGSEKRKMREQGKREAREMNEDKSWLPAAHDAFSGFISPADVTTHFQNKKFSSAEEFKSAVKQLADDHSDKFISTQHREGPDSEKAMQDWSDKIVDKFDTSMTQRAERQKSWGSLGKSHTSEPTSDYVNLRDPNTGQRRRIAGHDAYDAMKDGFYESIQHRLEKSLLEGWPDRESQRQHAPHELGVPDDIADYEGEELPHDAVHAEHYENARKTLAETEKKTGDRSHANSLVARSAIAAALAHASMSRSNDPTLRHIQSILRGHHDALDDHFKQKQSESDIPFEEAVQYGLIPVEDAIVILETITEASFEDYQNEWKRAEDATHPDIPRGMQLSKLAGMFNKVVKKKTGEYKDRIKQTLSNDMKIRDVSGTTPVRLNKQQSSFASGMGRSEAERQVPEYKALERRVNLAGAVYSKQADVSSAENEKFVSGLKSTLKAKGLSGKVKVRVDRETGKYHVTDASGQTHMVDHYVFANTDTGLILESYYEIRK